MQQKLRVAVVGLNFGSEFIPIYQQHPNVEEVVICDTNEALLNQTGDRFAVKSRFTTLESLVKNGQCDAVHLFTPVPYHVEHSVLVLEAGFHCACAVPMSTDMAGLHRVVAAQKASGKNYMMMETAVYTRGFLCAKELYDKGELGDITFLRGTYYQDLEGAYPALWRAQPPMHYSTHVVAPILALAQCHVESVVCMGSGRLRPDIHVEGGNIFPLQTALFRLTNNNLAAEVTRSWFQTAHAYTEAFSVYGDRKGFEWQQIEDENPVVYTLEAVDPLRRGRNVTIERVVCPDRHDLLPPEIAHFTSGGHGGSHPYLVHEFISSIIENRSPAIDAATSANWTVPGICANESSLLGGQLVNVPHW